MSAPRGRARGGGRGVGRNGLLSGSSNRGSSKANSRGSAASPGVRPVSSATNDNTTIQQSVKLGKSSTHIKPADSSRLNINALPAWRDPTKIDYPTYLKRIEELFPKIRAAREEQRKRDISNGLLADPDKPTTLAEAITPIGTCMDMCSEYERLQRIRERNIEDPEKIKHPESGIDVPCEARMVKRFRRSAAGTDEQIPSDIRPPAVLRKTLDYLLDEVVGGPEPLVKVHKFVWDRTRAIRNDFSILQVTKLDDVKIAMECFERMARFHIVSLHQLSRPTIPDDEFDPYQEREQLSRTLLSLMYYYDDNRSKYQSPNEAEFRAYLVIFEIQEQRPDIEDRAQTWPKHIFQHPRVQTALKLHASAGESFHGQGPLRPHTRTPIAQNFYGRFWTLVSSSHVPYMMACVAEIYFNFVRRNALETLWKAFKGPRQNKSEDMILSDVADALGFDNQLQTESYCKEHGFTIGEREDGEAYLDLNSVTSIKDAKGSGRRQMFSRTYVEFKRSGRTLPAVIRGYNVARCRAEGLVVDSSTAGSEDEKDENLFVSDDEADRSAKPLRSQAPDATAELAVTAPPAHNPFAPAAPNPFTKPIANGSTSSFSPFQQAIASAQKPLPAFGMPTTTNDASSAFLQPSTTFPNNPFGPHVGTNSFGHLASTSAVPDSTSEHQKNSSPLNTNLKPLNPFNAATAPATSLAPGAIASTSQAPSLSSQPNPFLAFDAANNGTVTKEANETAKPSDVASFTPSEPSKPHSPFAFPPQATQADATEKSQAPSQSSFFQQPPTSIPPSQPSSTFPSTATSAPPAFTFSPSSTTPQVSPASNNTSSAGTTSASSIFGVLQTTTRNDTSTTTFKPNPQPSTQPGIATSAIPKLVPGNFPNVPKAPVPPPQHSPQPPLEHLTPVIQKPSPKPPSTGDLALQVMLGNGGILEQFIENSLNQYIPKAMKKVEREKEKMRVKEARAYLLSFVYGRRWRRVAWSRKLARQGRERRQNFAQSMRDLAKSSRESTPADLDPLASLLASRQRRPEPQLPAPAPSAAVVSHKRHSLPNGASKASQATQSRPSDMPPPSVPNGVSHKSTQKPHHKRSHTVGVSLNATTSGRVGKYTNSLAVSRSKMLTSQINTDEALIKKARHLASGRLDTTQTDYFRLKAMGVDPDTPVVPRVLKRSREPEDDDAESRKSTRSTPPESSSITQRSIQASATSLPSTIPVSRPVAAKEDDDLEDILQRAREAREAMAKDMEWFRDARETISRSRSQSRDIGQNTAVKASTPSRTTLRLQQTGAHGLYERAQRLRASKLEKEREQQKEKERASMVESDGELEILESPKLGPARPPASNGVAWTNGFASSNPFGSLQNSMGNGGTGASADDAIEL